MTPPPGRAFAAFRPPFRVAGERIFDRNGAMVAAKLGQYAPHWFPVGWVQFDGPGQSEDYAAWRDWWAREVPDSGDAADVIRALRVAWGAVD